MKRNLLMIFTILFLSLLFVLTTNSQTDDNSNKDEKKNGKHKQDRPLRITGKSPPSREVFSKCFEKDARQTFLLISLRVAFPASGKITDVEIVKSSGCNYFDKEAIRVAKKIKFKPEIKGGESVTVTKMIEYSSGIN